MRTALMKRGDISGFATLFLAILVLAGIPAAAMAANSPGSALDRSVSFHIDAQPLSSGLLEFSDQSGVQVVSRTSLVSGSYTNGVHGRLSIREGLGRLLAQTGLSYMVDADRTISLVKEATAMGDPHTPGITAASITDPSPTFAQNAPSAATSGSPANTNVNLGKILVTGSMIRRTSVETPAPVTIITAEQLKATGLSSVGAILQTLVSNNSGTVPINQTGGFAGGGIGESLRGLSANSTLVLIDGQRVADYALQNGGTINFPDIGTIPMNVVERIEILKDGASSIYGADAIAGVINIILYPSFTGSKVNAKIGTSQHGGGTQTDVDFITGTGDLDTDHYNAYVSFGYHLDQPILAKYRGFPFSTCDFRPQGYATSGCVGGAAVSPSIYGVEYPALVSQGTPNGIPPTFDGGDILSGKVIPGTSGVPMRACPTPVTYPGTGIGTGTGCEYNQNIVNGLWLSQKTTTYSVDSRVTVNPNPTTSAYLNVSYMQNRTLNSGGAPSSFTGSSPVNDTALSLPSVLPNGTLNPNNLFANSSCLVSSNINTPSCPYALIQYDGADLPSRQAFWYTNHAFRTVGNISGAINENWNYTAALTIEQTWVDRSPTGRLSEPQILTDVTNGTYNFIDPSQNSSAVRSALAPGFDRVAQTSLDEINGNVNGTLAELPGGPLGLGVGVQWFYQSLSNPTPVGEADALATGVQTAAGHDNVAALFAELDAPILPSFEADLSAREDHYSDFGGAFSPKIGLKWTPVPQLSLRGTYSRGFRAPYFTENGTGSTNGYSTLNLPVSFLDQHCAVGTAPPNCVPDAYITNGSGRGVGASSISLEQETIGNPDIKPERARNYTLGMVFQPFISFSGTVDYYNIVKTNVITAGSTGSLLDDYFAGLPTNPAELILDSPDPLHPNALPLPVLVNLTYINENMLRTSGFDVNLRYTLDTNIVNWTTNFQGTKIESFCETFVNGGPCVSELGFDAGSVLNYRWNWANTFTFGAFSITGTVYWHSNLRLGDPAFSGSACTNTFGLHGAPVPADCTEPAFWYLNLTGTWNITNSLQLQGGILNATDKAAPFNGTSYNSTYDQIGAVGRFFQVGLQVKF